MEEFPENNIEKQEPREITPEELGEMLSQIPALKEMLEERKERVKGLEGEEKEALMQEIAELEEEIAGREEWEKDSE